MPLQHIHDEILMRMKRRVTRKQIEALLKKLRKWIPGISIRTTFIAGAPGETDGQHEELVEFVKDFGFDMMGVFPYSREPGTPMGRAEDQVPDAVKQSRVEELMFAQQEVAFARAKGMVGRTVEVLVDSVERAKAQAVARMSGQAPEIDSVVHVKAKDVHPGQLLNVTIRDWQRYDLIAEAARAKGKSLKVLRA
jgi:ribosomal protein S12 methylthiotransferase